SVRIRKRMLMERGRYCPRSALIPDFFTHFRGNATTPVITYVPRCHQLGFPERGFRLLFRKDAHEIAILPLYPDGMAVDVPPGLVELDLAAWAHCGIALADFELG